MSLEITGVSTFDFGVIEQHNSSSDLAVSHKPLTGTTHQKANAISHALISSPDIFKTEEGLVQLVDLEAKKLTEYNIIDRVSALYGQDIDAKTAKVVLHRGKWEGVRSLKHVAGAAVIYPNGELITSAGYHEKTGTLFAEGGCYPDVKHNASLDDAKASFEWLRDVALDEFALATEEDRASAVAGLMTSVVRVACHIAPIWHVNAATPGTGKSTLQGIGYTLNTGAKPVTTKLSEDGVEQHKQLFTSARMKTPYVLSDNHSRNINSDALNMTVTSGVIEGRVLGKSESVVIPVRFMIATNGNNVNPTGDMLRRSLVTKLYSELEKPETREFKRKGLDTGVWAAENREEAIRHVLTIAKAYINAGKPAQPVKPVGFSDWETLVRLPIIWVSGIDPMIPAQRVSEDDPTHARIVTSLTVLRQTFGGDSFTWSEALKNRGVFDMFLTEHGDHLTDPKKLATWADNRADRVFSGLRLRRDPAKVSPKRWRVECLDVENCPERVETETGKATLAKPSFFNRQHD